MKEFGKSPHIALVIRGLGGRSGGAERIYCELANILCNEGYRVTCLYFDSKDIPPFFPIDKKVERINLYSPIRTSKQNIAFLVKKIPILKRIYQNEIDWYEKNDFFVYQLNDYFKYAKPAVCVSLMPPANTPALMASIGTSVKVVATNHNVPAQDYESAYRWDPNPVDRRLRLKMLDHAAAIHVLFPSFGDWFPAHLRERIISIPNYVSDEFAHRPLPEKRDKLILAVGRLAEVKNYGQLIRAWSTLAADFPEWNVVIYGTGPLKRQLAHEIAQLGLQKSVRLAGHRGQLDEEYARAAIFCHPAHFEGFGLSPAEALFMETPVVAYSDCDGVKEFLRDGWNGIAVDRVAGDSGLADALRGLMEDSELRERLGKNGPESVGRFTIERYRESWRALIEKLIGED